MPYNEELSDWLKAEGFNYPQLQDNNRLPTTGEIAEAMKHLKHDKSNAYWVDDVNWENEASIPENGFRTKGDRKEVLKLLKHLSFNCGQLCLYPDTGEPPIVVDTCTDIDLVINAHEADPDYEYEWNIFAEKAWPNLS